MLALVDDPFTAATHAQMDRAILAHIGADPSLLAPRDDCALTALLGFVDVDIRSVQGYHLDLSAYLMLEYRPELRDVLRRALERQSFREVRLLECLWPIRAQRSTRWLTISFVRHGQSVGNVLGPHASGADALTRRGEAQAALLGTLWAHMRIDALHSSTLARAKKTAAAIASAHTPRLAVQPSRWLVERSATAREQGAWDRSGRPVEGHERLAGVKGRWRGAAPDGEGETFEDVAARAVHYLLCLFSYHGVPLPAPPPIGKGDALPEGVPHVVVVAHNFLLCEMWEALLGWNDDAHVEDEADYAQAGWSRHVLGLHGDDRAGKGRAKLYGRLEHRVLQAPGKYDPTNVSIGENAALVPGGVLIESTA